MSEGTRPCPYCGERVAAEARVCRHCRRALTAVVGVRRMPRASPANVPALLRLSLLTLAILTIIGTFYYGLLLAPGDASTSEPLLAATALQVEYRVGGTAERASLTYSNVDGGTDQASVSLPYTATLTVTAGEFLYLAAQNEGGTGSIVCEIWIDGAPWRTAEVSGAYGIAACSGRAGME